MKKGRSVFRHWHEVTLLFIESKQARYTAFRIYTLVKEKSPLRALQKSIDLWKNAPHPHGVVRGAKWKFAGPTHIYECLTPPVPGGMLGCYKETGRTWNDALRYIRPESQFELNTFHWGKPPAPEYLYRVDLVYFVRPNVKTKLGKVTTCTCVVKSPAQDEVQSHAYQLALQKKTRKRVIRIRRDASPKSIVEFVGIRDIIPVYRKIEDGMEFNRTVERYSTKKAIYRLIRRPSELIWREG